MVILLYGDEILQPCHGIKETWWSSIHIHYPGLFMPLLRHRRSRSRRLKRRVLLIQMVMWSPLLRKNKPIRFRCDETSLHGRCAAACCSSWSLEPRALGYVIYILVGMFKKANYIPACRYVDMSNCLTCYPKVPWECDRVQWCSQSTFWGM